MAWTTEQAYPIFLDVVLCVDLTTILFNLIYFVCMYVFSYLNANITIVEIHSSDSCRSVWG